MINDKDLMEKRQKYVDFIIYKILDVISDYPTNIGGMAMIVLLVTNSRNKQSLMKIIDKVWDMYNKSEID